MNTRSKTIHALIIASMALFLTAPESTAKDADYSDFGGGYSGQLTMAPGPGVFASGPAIALVAPSRNGESARIEFQGNFVLGTDQFTYDTSYRISRTGKVNTSNLLLFNSVDGATLDLTASSRAKLKGKRLKMQFIKTVNGTPVVSTLQMRFSKRSVACQCSVSTGMVIATVSGNLRKRVGG